MAVIVMLALLAVMLVFVSVNMRSLVNLESETKRIEQRQIHRLETRGATNVVEVSLPASGTNVPATGENRNRNG